VNLQATVVLHVPSTSRRLHHQLSRKQIRAVWLSGNALASISCATSDLVSTRMGDCLRAGKPSRYVTSQLGRLSLLPSVGR